jgi:alpha-D-xyloside xylohydrolase
MVEGQRKQKVYLPADAQWKDYWSHEIYEGGITIEADAELDTIPVFLKIH